MILYLFCILTLTNLTHLMSYSYLFRFMGVIIQIYSIIIIATSH